MATPPAVRLALNDGAVVRIVRPKVSPENTRASPSHSRCATFSWARSLATMTSLLYSHVQRMGTSDWRIPVVAANEDFFAADAVFWLRDPLGFSHNNLSFNARIDPILKELLAVTKVISLFRSLFHLMRNFKILRVTPFTSTYCNLVWATGTKTNLKKG